MRSRWMKRGVRWDMSCEMGHGVWVEIEMGHEACGWSLARSCLASLSRRCIAAAASDSFFFLSSAFFFACSSLI